MLSLDVGVVLLDLTAGFDTADHSTLTGRLKEWVGVSGSTLNWFSSFLCCLVSTYFKLFPFPMVCPRVLCPVLFVLDMLLLSHIIGTFKKVSLTLMIFSCMHPFRLINLSII